MSEEKAGITRAEIVKTLREVMVRDAMYHGELSERIAGLIRSIEKGVDYSDSVGKEKLELIRAFASRARSASKKTGVNPALPDAIDREEGVAQNGWVTALAKRFAEISEGEPVGWGVYADLIYAYAPNDLTE